MARQRGRPRPRAADARADAGDAAGRGGPAAPDQQLHRRRRPRARARPRRRLRLDPRALAGADLVVLPGTRATIADLAWLRRAASRRGRSPRRGRPPVLGICGGSQMLGRTIADPDGVEGSAGATVEGLGLLDVRTEFGAEKVLRLPTGTGYRPPATRSTTAASAARTRVPRRARAGAVSPRCGTAASRTTLPRGLPASGRGRRV